MPMTPLMNFFLILLLLINTAGASPSLAIYNPQGNVVGRFIISHKGYEDVRIDANLDGKIDFWHIKKGSIIVDVYFKDGGMDLYTVRKLNQRVVTEIQYKIQNGSLQKQVARIRKPLEMPDDPQNPLCESTLNRLTTRIRELTGAISREGISSAVESELIDKSCQAILTDEEYEDLKNNMKEYLEPDTDSFARCFSNRNFPRVFGPPPGGALSAQILKASYDLQRRQLALNPDQYKPTIKCAERPTGVTSHARTSEIGVITFYKTARANPLLGLPQRNVLNHEFFHRLGLFREDKVKDLMRFCRNPNEYSFLNTASTTEVTNIVPPVLGNAGAIEAANAQTAQVNPTAAAPTPNTPGRGPAATAPAGEASARTIQVPSGTVAGAAVEVAQATSANIPATMTVAQTGVPLDNSLSTVVSNPPPQTPAGAATALAISQRQSAPVLARAEALANAIVPTARAADRETPSLAGADPVQERRTARSPASRIPVAADSLQRGDRVVEEIRVDTATPAVAATRAPGPTAPQESPPSTRAPSSVAPSAPRAATAVAAPSNAGPVLTPASGTTYSGGTPAPVQRRRPTAAATAASADEVVTYLTGGEYASVRRRLSDPVFNRQLVQQNIKVLDLQGNTYGAPQGQVILLDNGARFVRQR